NFLIFKGLLETAYLEPVSQRVNNLFSIVFAAISIPVGGIFIYRLALRVSETVRQRYVTPDLCYLIAVLSLTAFIFHLILFNREQLLTLSWDQTLIPVLFLVSATRLISYYLFEPIRKQLGYRLESLAP